MLGLGDVSWVQKATSQAAQKELPLLHMSTQCPGMSLHVGVPRPSPVLVLQATNAGARRPGYEATLTLPKALKLLGGKGSIRRCFLCKNFEHTAMILTNSSLKRQLEVFCSTFKVPRLQMDLAQEREYGGRFGQTLQEGDSLGYGGQREIRV